LLCRLRWGRALYRGGSSGLLTSCCNDSYIGPQPLQCAHHFSPFCICTSYARSLHLYAHPLLRPLPIASHHLFPPTASAASCSCDINSRPRSMSSLLPSSALRRALHVCVWCAVPLPPFLCSLPFFAPSLSLLPPFLCSLPFFAPSLSLLPPFAPSLCSLPSLCPIPPIAPKHAAAFTCRYVCSVAATIITKQLFHRADMGPDVLTLCQFSIGSALSLLQIAVTPPPPASSVSRLSFKRFWPSSIAPQRLFTIALVYAPSSQSASFLFHFCVHPRP
jgi:hypothetical protein